MHSGWLLALAVSVDTLFAAMGCRMQGIIIPRRCMLLISLVGTGMLGLSLGFGAMLRPFLPEVIFRCGGGTLLLVLGFVQTIKELCARFAAHERSMCLHCRGIGLVIRIYFDETAADADGSKILSIPEAFAFSAALSLDSLVSGMGAGLPASAMPLTLILTFLLGLCAVAVGAALGRQSLRKSRFSCLGGILLMVLGLIRLLSA